MTRIEQGRKKAIVVVSFGTTYRQALQDGIESIEHKIKQAFPEYEVRRAFTSRTVIKRLQARDGLQIDTEKQALERLKQEGYREVYIQPLHVVAGEEYEKIKKLVIQYRQTQEDVFDLIALGRPLLYYMGQHGQPDDYVTAIQAMTRHMPQLGTQEAVVLMGHGGVHPANAAYGALQIKQDEIAENRWFVYTVEGFPGLGSVIAKLKKYNIQKVHLIPLLLVAGDHACNDMASEEEDSGKSQLQQAGFTVEVYLRGLGENPAIQDIYVQHLQDAMKAE